MKIYNKMEELIGKTPLFEVEKIEKAENLNAKIYVKLEYFNPTGSVKDRAALYMIEDAEKKGLLRKGATIIEPTSGNTGIGIAAIGAAKGYKVILTMPESMSVERRNFLKAFGAELVLTEAKKGMAGAVEKARELNKEIEGSFIPGQFENKANMLAHYMTTGPEIYADTDGKVNMLVSGIGTGGTMSGTGKFLKEKIKDFKVVAVEPETSPLLSKGVAGPHKIQGIGANFVPDNFDKDVCDMVMTVADAEAFKYAKMMARLEGLLVGISSGAALSAAIKLAKNPENKGKVIVAIMPDNGDRYMSMGIYD